VARCGGVEDELVVFDRDVAVSDHAAVDLQHA
jgi:hypothetical protein